MDLNFSMNRIHTQVNLGLLTLTYDAAPIINSKLKVLFYAFFINFKISRIVRMKRDLMPNKV